MRTQRDRRSLVRFLNRWRINSRPRQTLLMAAALLPLILLSGCSGIVSGSNSQPQNTQPQTFFISGTISPITGGSGATVTLSGATGATTTADGSGIFTFTALANGTYTVTPSHTGYTFSPTSLSVTINGANVTTGLSFTATSQTQTYSISGTISPTAGGSGAKVVLSGLVTASTTTDSSGNYTFSGLANGNYALTPSHTGYTFSPASQSAPVNGANVTGINFTATAQTTPTYSITGTISPTAGGSGATVLLTGPAAATTTTDSAGNYTFSGLTNGAYTVTPNSSGYTFSPVSQSVTINAANLTGMNFTATAQQPHSVALTWIASTSTVAGYNVYRLTGSGTVYTMINSSLVTTLAYTDTTVQSATTYSYVTTAVDASGKESIYSNPASAQIP
jgi:hypothetical protein